MSPLPATRWNPSGLNSNCGFCSISYALEQQKGFLITADQLYDQTLERLHIPRNGNQIPLPYALIFPVAGQAQPPIPVHYQALEGHGMGAADYTIWSVARHAGLELKAGDKTLLNHLVEFAAQKHTPWRLDDFITARMSIPALAARGATFANMKRHVETSLNGNSIIGSIKAQHFVNMSFNPAGEWTVFDAQSGLRYDGKLLKAKMISLDLFERVSTGN